MTNDTGLIPLCATADVSDDMALRVEHDGEAYAVYLLDGQYYVTADLCTHGPGLMSEGFIEGCEIECPFHQGKFNIITGAPTSPPCTEALKIWPVRVQDGRVWIDPTAGTVAAGA